MEPTLCRITDVLEILSHCNNVVTMCHARGSGDSNAHIDSVVVPYRREHRGNAVLEVVVPGVIHSGIIRTGLCSLLCQALHAEPSKQDLVGSAAVFGVILESGTLEVLHRVDLAGVWIALLELFADGESVNC